MGETWLTQIVSDCWFITAAAFCIGLLTGWTLWARRQGHEEITPAEPDSGDLQTHTQSPKGNEEALDALARELETTQKLLEESQAESDAYNDILGNLDDAVKRANGRLKLIAKSIKRQ